MRQSKKGNIFNQFKKGTITRDVQILQKWWRRKFSKKRHSDKEKVSGGGGQVGAKQVKKYF